MSVDGSDAVQYILVALAVGLFILLAVTLLLPGCISDGQGYTEIEDQRYKECLAAGGSWSTDDTDWSCIVKGAE